MTQKYVDRGSFQRPVLRFFMPQILDVNVLRSNFEEKDFHLVVYQKKPCCVEMPLKVTSATKR